MSDTVIKVENLSKLYRLGEVGTGTLSHDLNRWWARIRGKEDPFTKVGQINDRTQKAGKDEYVWALKDINFEVKQGEVLGIIGKNGAGKSTLLKILSRITAPTTGEINIHGRVGSLLEVGTGFHPEMTGRENIYMNGTILGMTKREITAKLDDIVDFAGVAKYVDTPVKRFSSGMMVRLGFAVAAFLEPEILIVDEVLAVGDAEFQKRAIGKMQEISEGGGRTVLFVSHNMGNIRNLCSRVILLKDGNKYLDDSKDYVINKYLSELNKEIYKSDNKNNRRGNGTLLIKEIYLENENSIKTNNFFSGDKLTFNLKYQLNIVKEINSVRVVIVIYDVSRNVLFRLVNENLGPVYQISTQCGIIKCTINNLPLSEGEYYFSIIVKSFNVLEDHIENAGSFQVQQGDYYGTGKLDDFSGTILIPYSWKLIENGNN